MGTDKRDIERELRDDLEALRVELTSQIMSAQCEIARLNAQIVTLESRVFPPVFPPVQCTAKGENNAVSS